MTNTSRRSTASKSAGGVGSRSAGTVEHSYRTARWGAVVLGVTLVGVGGWRLPVAMWATAAPRIVSAQDTAFVPRTLSPFAAEKALALLRDRLPCLGCHRLEGEGGRIGPDLTGVGSRRTPSQIYRIVREPGRALPGTIMPKHPMPQDQLELIASFLSASTGPAGEQPLATAAAPVTGDSDGAALYARHCTPCHGTAGEGDGYNAPFLPVTPTAHADNAAMSLRPDDVLYDGIAAGGRILGKSHRMPAFGEALSPAAIRAIVAHIRRLCRCQGPAWSRDGSSAGRSP